MGEQSPRVYDRMFASLIGHDISVSARSICTCLRNWATESRIAESSELRQHFQADGDAEQPQELPQAGDPKDGGAHKCLSAESGRPGSNRQHSAWKATADLNRKAQETLANTHLSASVGFRKPSQLIAFSSVLWWYYHINVVVKW